MNATSAAPRLSASMPIAPVPAKRSAKRAPEIFGANTLNNVSRKRSLVGRSARPFKLLRMRLRYVPAMTRMSAAISCQFLVFSQGGRLEAEWANGTAGLQVELNREVIGNLVCDAN